MGRKFDDLRKELDSLGYKQKFHPECVPLVEKLLADLNTTTTNLQKYMKISQIALEERDNLEVGTEPYKCDNAKLIQECNDLHIAFIHFKEQHEKIQRDLRNQISILQIRLENCNLEKGKIMSQLQKLEKEKYRKASRSVSKDQTIGKENKNFVVNTSLRRGDANVVMDKEFKDLYEKYTNVAEDNVILQNQLATREDEINRLQSLLQGGRPFKAVSKDCCYQNVDGQIGVLQDEITRLKKEKNDVIMQVKDALAKQHEAMRRALHLAERNRQLEKEMRAIDEIALAVETECNSTVKGNTEKVTRLQDRINESLILIQNLEQDNVKLKHDKSKLSADLDSVKLEKIHLQKQLDYDVDDKKRLSDRINNFTIIENDLNLEIDRLTKLTAEQKRKIVELESQVSSDHKSRKDTYQRADVEVAEYKEQLQDKERLIKEFHMTDGACSNPNCRRREREVDIKTKDLGHLELENNTMKFKLQNNLDEKTEKIAGLEDDLSSKNKTIARLEGELKELRRKLSKYVDETSSKEQLVRSSRQQVDILEQDYEKEKRLKESAIAENRRLQGDLTAITADCRDARNELEISRRQVEDLKRQLQHYVAEVKRTEDLISNKELERSELLDQFRYLSQEANILESNNHTLENEATQSKVQLSVALDHTSDLERKLENQESIIRSYEKQISDLTSQVARLEMQLKQTNKEHDQYDTEIRQMRDLCVKLDKDKDSLKHELYSKEDRRSQVDKAADKLELDKQALQRALEKDRTSLQAVEKLLNEARQEITEQRLLNQDMQKEVGRLKQKIAELEERLTITSEQLDIYQCKALEYSQLNKQLRREIANERFSKARSDDKGYYPSL